MRHALKAIARSAALVVVVPALISYWIRRALIGELRAFEGSAQAFALLPGTWGVYVRRAFLSRVLAECHPSAVIAFGVLLSDPRASIGAAAYIGPGSQIGFARIERDVLIGSGVIVTSGRGAHGTDDVTRPIRDQPGARHPVTIGEGSWIGSGTVVMADIGKHTVIGAGAVVAKPIPDFVVAAGVPARVIRSRTTPAG
jgi:virginiamycin A acetyltransferase